MNERAPAILSVGQHVEAIVHAHHTGPADNRPQERERPGERLICLSKNINLIS